LLLAAFVAVAGSTTDAFLTDTNLTNLMKQMVTTGLLAYGMLVVIVTGGIDLSVGSVVALTGIMAAGLAADMPVPFALLAGVAVGIGCGAVNGTLVARFVIAPFVVTLAALTTVRGLAFVYSETPVAPTEESFFELGSATAGPFPVATLIMLGVFLLGGIFLTRTAPGRALVAIGGNAEAVRLAGIGVRRHHRAVRAGGGRAAGPHRRAARRGRLRPVRHPPDGGDVRRRRPGDRAARRPAGRDPADGRLRRGLPRAVDGRPPDREPLPR